MGGKVHDRFNALQQRRQLRRVADVAVHQLEASGQKGVSGAKAVVEQYLVASLAQSESGMAGDVSRASSYQNTHFPLCLQMG